MRWLSRVPAGTSRTRLSASALLLLLLTSLCATAVAEEALRQIVFASCLKETKPAPALDSIAALEPDLFASVTISRSLCSWSNVIELGRTEGQLTNVVHGALTCYDLPNLAEMLGDKLTISDPVDALERPMDAASVGDR